MMPDPIKPLSEAIFDPVTRAYNAGGLGLSFVTLGSFMMLAAFLLQTQGTLSYVLVFVGFGLVSLTGYFFYVKEIRPLRRARENIAENRELIDAVQAAALEMTELASVVQALAFKHATLVADTINVLRPQLQKLPMLAALADLESLARADKLSEAIVTATDTAKGVVDQVKTSLLRSDASGLKRYVGELRALRDIATRILKSSAQTESIPSA